MLLLTGPAGSGKTTRVLEGFRDALRRRDGGVRLLTPTATMAQHLQNQLAREGFVFRPGLIQTLSHFVDSFAADLPQVSEPLLYLIVEEAAARVNRPEFARVVEMPGFCAALARTMEEFSSAGCDAERLANRLPRAGGPAAPLGEAFVAVYREVERQLGRRGLATRSQRLLHAAERIAGAGLSGIHTIWLDGFYALPDPELEVIGATCRHADVTVTLPSAPLTEPTRARLVAMGFAEEVCSWKAAPPGMELCEAPSIEREADEIGRRILEQAAAGRRFRDMGIIVRSPELYEPILRVTLDRFGIPARFYFDGDLESHALVRFLRGIVDAMLGGWEYEDTLAAIRLAPGITSDAFDFDVRETMPGKGLQALWHLAAGSPAVLALLQSLDRLEPWRALSAPPPEWSARLQTLRSLFAPGQLDPGSYELAAIARGQAEALDLFDAALGEAAAALGGSPVRLSEFWRAAKSVLRLTPLRAADSRRDVVHVLGAYEARQWRLPVVFVCGLVEKQFPKFHTQDPFFPEAARAQLKQAGIRLRTAADFEAEERFLFDSAMARATELLTLTYPRTDARGQQNLRSLYLDGVDAEESDWKAVQPEIAAHARGERPPAAISSPDLLEVLAARHRKFGPRVLEYFMQCPFQFFGRETLRLKEPPARPEERLDFKAQGIVVHEVLSVLHADPGPVDEVFDAVFARVCTEKHIPSCYRTETLRQRMLSDLRALVEDPDWPPRGEVLTEQRFRYTLGAGVDISGRIDRIDKTSELGATVIDYKYSAAQNIKAMGKNDALLQPQLYMLALERSFGLRPEGMAYWGFKKKVERTPLILFDPAPAIETALRIAGEVRAGRIEPHPADIDKCRLCELLDVCRYRAARAASAEGEAQWD